MVIRPAGAGDAHEIAQLIDELGYPVTPDQVDARLKILETAGECALVAELDGKVVACLSISTTKVLHRPAPVGRISMMVVDEALRGRGIGAELVAAAERLLAERGCQLVEVTSNVKLRAAHAFYERIGFERTSHRFARSLGD